MSKSAIKRAAAILGSQQALANILGLRSQGSISTWIRSGKVPAEHVLSIEKATKGAVSRNDLRPDLYPEEACPVDESASTSFIARHAD